ncbi:MAG: hypothetical protein SOT71_12320 [Romboutsia timonensis]|uniref:hypothetical protein n=1 Tax=Romboutsia timonensis TaxID=1776391 RepID=UPI002A75EAAA|nr:hypothetical protein [Romboutsia timonensis]MDY2883426.1 hypothetical protein [Romboutsia timonensis]
MDKKDSVRKILSQYDKKTILLYNNIARIERDTRHKIRRTEVKNDIKDMIEKVVKDETI